MKIVLNLLAVLNRHALARENRLAAVRRFLTWQLHYRLGRGPMIVTFVNRTSLVLEKGLTAATGNFYFGLTDFSEMGFLLHFLRPGDLFGDIGANIGAYSILASGVCGAHSLAMEASPDTVILLQRNIALNEIAALVQIVPCGAGAARTTLNLTTGKGAMNRFTTTEEGIKVPVMPLDEILSSRTPILLKIDVEGFEPEVLRGASRILGDAALKAVIIEWPGALDTIFRDHGYASYDYDPRLRILTPAAPDDRQNVLYLRDLPFVTQRVAAAAPFRVLDQII